MIDHDGTIEDVRHNIKVNVIKLIITFKCLYRKQMRKVTSKSYCFYSL